MKTIFLITFIFTNTLCFAQNLVRNPSFEDITDCKYKLFNSFDTAGYRLTTLGPNYWISPSLASPDYFNPCQYNEWPGGLGAPQSSFGYQEARTGKCYVGLTNYNRGPWVKESREYIQTRLSQPLKNSKKHCLSFYINTVADGHWRPDFPNTMLTDDIHIALTQQRVTNRTPMDPPEMGDTILDNRIITDYIPIGKNTWATDTSKWYRVNTIYTAKGGEEWLTIGNFKKATETNTQLLFPASPFGFKDDYLCYYFIDDVSVSELSIGKSPPKDTTVCTFPFTIKAASGFDTYLWSTGETTQSISITQPGRYIVSGTMQECGTISDTITVHQQDVQVTSRRDTTGCLPMLLTAKSAVGGYLWNTNESTQNITAAQAGKYWVQRNVAACSTAIDTIQVRETEPPMPLSFADTLVCSTAFPLQYAVPQVFTQVQWNDNTTNSVKNIIKSGTYTLKADWQCGTLRDTFVVQSENPLPPLQLLTRDTTSCAQGHFQAFRLRAPYGYPNYVWNTGATTRNISVLKSEIYEVVSSNICGSVSDKITVMGCPPNYYIPNAFTPNGDGHNDVFTIFATDAIVNIKSMAIFDRWGEQVAELQNIPPTLGGAGGGSLGWDGTFKNQPAASEVYVYIMIIQFADGTTETVKGDVTLLR